MATKRSGLGKGLDSLIPSVNGVTKPVKQTIENADEKTKAEESANTAVKKATTRKEAVKESTKKTTTKKAAASKPTAKKATGTKKTTSKSTSTAAKKKSEEKNKQDIEESQTISDVLMLPLSKIEPNAEQPRTDFKEEALAQLADSIRQFGVIEPLIVQKNGKYYDLIAGERRWRAARIAGLTEVPVVIRDYTKQEAIEIALIENIQREDLNPIEEAIAYQRLLDEFQLKHEDIAERVSKSRTTITNALRLLKLDPRVQKMLVDGLLSTGHARTLLGLSDFDEQYLIAGRIVGEGLNVRETEQLINRRKAPKKAKTPKISENRYVYQNMEDRMKEIYGTKIKVAEKSNGKGKIEIEYYSVDELERIYHLLLSVK